MKHPHQSRWPVPSDEWPVAPATLAAQHPYLSPELFEGLFSEEFAERDASRAVQAMKILLEDARRWLREEDPGRVYYCTDVTATALTLLLTWVREFHAATRTGLTRGNDDDSVFELQIRFLKTLLSALALTDEGETHDA